MPPHPRLAGHTPRRCRERTGRVLRSRHDYRGQAVRGGATPARSARAGSREAQFPPVPLPPPPPSPSVLPFPLPSPLFPLAPLGSDREENACGAPARPAGPTGLPSRSLTSTGGGCRGSATTGTARATTASAPSSLPTPPARSLTLYCRDRSSQIL